MTTQAQKVLEKAMEKDFIEKPLRHDQHRAANFILLKIKKFAIKIDKLAEKVLKRKDQWQKYIQRRQRLKEARERRSTLEETEP